MQARLARIFPLVVRWFRDLETSRRIGDKDVPATSTALMSFGTETAPQVAGRSKAARLRIAGRLRRRPALQASLATVAAVAIFTAWILMGRASTYVAPGGRLTVETNPPGATVVLDGVSQGVTPLSMPVEAGTHGLVIRSDYDERKLSLSVAPGLDTYRSFELKTAPPANLGGVTVITEPAGLSVTIDGKPAGKSPLTVSNLKPADHTIKVSGDGFNAERTVRVSGGSVASVVFAAPKGPTMAAGWLTVRAPFDVEVREGSDLIGRGDMAKIMLTAGRHDITLANQRLGYEQPQKVTVIAGKGTTLELAAPQAMVSANARPWADVLVDGKNIGQTPIANFAIPIGAHEVLFRHPQLGERREQVTVTRNGPNRIAVDLTR